MAGAVAGAGIGPPVTFRVRAGASIEDHQLPPGLTVADAIQSFSTIPSVAGYVLQLSRDGTPLHDHDVVDQGPIFVDPVVYVRVEGSMISVKVYDAIERHTIGAVLEFVRAHVEATSAKLWLRRVENDDPVPLDAPVRHFDYGPRCFLVVGGLGVSFESIIAKFSVNLSDFEKVPDLVPGAFGDVYVARERRTGSLVVVKVLRAVKGEGRRFFNREVTIMASLDHPALLTLRGMVRMDAQNGDPPSIVTEFMPNGSLQNMVDMDGEGRAPREWDWTQKWIVVYGIAFGMRILHSCRIIHRDLKPDNVLLDGNLEPKVADFGLSRSVDLGASTGLSTGVGTPLYQAPEVFTEIGYGFPVDVYAFGVLFNSVMSGRRPFHEFPGMGGFDLDIK